MTDETKTSPPEEDAAFIDRLEAFNKSFLERYGKIIDDLVKSRPNFYLRVLVDILKGGLNTLRHCIETPGDPEVSWSSPWVEAHYPAEWDWEKGSLKFPLKEWPEPIMDSIRKGEDPFKLKEAEVINTTAEIIAKTSPSLVLQVLTHNVAGHIKDGGTADGVFFLDHEDGEKWESLSTDEEKDAMIDRLREAVSFGGIQAEDEEGRPFILTPLESLKEESEEGPPLPPGIKEKLRETPRLTFDGEVNGVAFKGSVVIIIQHLIVDEDKREAYFPVVVGLVFAPKESSLVAFTTEKETLGPENIEEALDSFKDTMEIMNPATWPEKDREELWKLLLVDLPASILEGLENGDKTESALLVPMGALSPERQRTIGIAFGQTLYSNQAMELLRTMNRIYLPKKWNNVKRWNNLEKEEVKAIFEEEGDRAFKDLKNERKDKDARGPLLKRYVNSSGQEEIKLSSEGYHRLRVRAGTGRGFVDVNPYGEEAFCKLYQVPGGGYLEIEISWNGLAGPIFEKWRDLQKKNTEADLKQLKESGSLFPGLNEDELKKAEARLDRLKTWGHGRLMMDVILGQVGIQKRNPVLIPAETFRVLLWPERSRTREWPAHWKHEVESALSSLAKFTFTMKSYKMESLKGYGVLVADWKYHELGTSGQGSRGDGEYKIIVNPGALGCLNIFESGKVSLRRGIEATSFLFKQTNEIKDALRKKREDPQDPDYYTMKDAGGVFYNTASKLNHSQMNLYSFIDRNVTIKSDPAKVKAARVGATAKDAKEPRLYTSALCPLLEKDKNYQGALGHFKQSRYPESGFTLGGTENKKGRRAGGLLDQMELTIPKGGKGKRKSAVITEGLENLRAVVEEYLEGIVAGNDGTGWIPLKDFPTLGERKLLKELHIFIFLPPEWRDRVRSKWENATDRRVTEDPKEAERDIIEGGDPGGIGEAIANEAEGFKGWPRIRRLHGMMKVRGINQKKLAKIFGVSAPLVSNWMKGESSRGDKVHRVAIPERLWDLVDQWIETGREPSLELLEASKKKEIPL